MFAVGKPERNQSEGKANIIPGGEQLPLRMGVGYIIKQGREGIFLVVTRVLSLMLQGNCSNLSHYEAFNQGISMSFWVIHSDTLFIYLGIECLQRRILYSK